MLLLAALTIFIQPGASPAAAAGGHKKACSTKSSQRHATSRSRKRAARCTTRAKRRAASRKLAGPTVMSLGLTDAAAESLTAIEDAYVTSSSPTANYGSASALRLDTRPQKVSYVKFDVPAGAAPVTQAVLMLYATTSSRDGVVAKRIPDSRLWNDWSVTWNSKPAADATTLASSGRFGQRVWVSLDVTKAVLAGTTVSFQLTTPSSTQTTFASTETGAMTAPQLKITRASIVPPPPPPPPPPAADTTAPSAPAALAANAQDCGAGLSWGAATDDTGVTGYRVYRNGTLVASPTGTTYTDSALTNGQTYSYTVKAADAAGNLSTASNTATATPAAPPDTTAPSAPASLTATPGNTQAQLAWTAATDNVAVTGYRVYRNGTLVASPTGTTYTDSALTNGQTYSYTVKAADAAGNLSTASNTATATPSAPVSGDPSAVRPYDNASPWNTLIGASPTVHPQSSTFINAISDNGLPLTSDPDQYTIPVYTVDGSTPLVKVQLRDGYGHVYDNGDMTQISTGFESLWSNVPVPSAASASYGSDGQIVLWNPITGGQWEFWQFRQAQHTDPNGTDPNNGGGNYTAPGSGVELAATNATKYHTTTDAAGNRYYGRMGVGVGGRGAGTPYFAGLVRPWEIAQGHIDHALAFAYASPAPTYVYPAAKSDGDGVTGVDPPEGTRLQLDPSITDAQMTAWGLSQTAKIIAVALQRYGMYVIDNSGSSKIYLEDRKTAGWDASITRNLVKNIPWSAFRAVNPPAQP